MTLDTFDIGQILGTQSNQQEETVPSGEALSQEALVAFAKEQIEDYHTNIKNRERVAGIASIAISELAGLTIGLLLTPSNMLLGLFLQGAVAGALPAVFTKGFTRKLAVLVACTGVLTTLGSNVVPGWENTHQVDAIRYELGESTPSSPPTFLMAVGGLAGMGILMLCSKK